MNFNMPARAAKGAAFTQLKDTGLRTINTKFYNYDTYFIF